MIVNVVSVRVGTKYDPIYSHILHDAVARNMSLLERRHWEVTDHPESCPEGVTPIPAPVGLPGWWAKIGLFSPDMPWSEGERVVFMDLDSVITGRLEDLAQTKGILKDKHWPMFSSAVMVWDHGEHRRIWERFAPEMMTATGPHPQLYPNGNPNGGDQEVITLLDPDWSILPAEWCVSYLEAQVWPPEGCKVVMFHGEKNKPHRLPDDHWMRDVWKVGGLTSLPEMQGMNVTRDAVLENVRENIQWPVEWFTGCPEHSKTLVLVCGGPSMKKHLQQIRDHKRRGARIATVNNALKYLVGKGIKPDHHIILDAREENVEFIKDAPEGIRYFLASQCHPSLFKELLYEKGKHDVILWHNKLGDGDDIISIVDSHYVGAEARPIIQVPGGCTVGLRALWLAWGSGYRKIHVYGMDSSYSGDEHHAYAQSLNEGEARLSIVMGGKTYSCAKWMARQANDFQRTYIEITAPPHNAQVFVHGEGLVPDMYRALRAQKEAA